MTGGPHIDVVAWEQALGNTSSNSDTAGGPRVNAPNAPTVAPPPTTAPPGHNGPMLAWLLAHNEGRHRHNAPRPPSQPTARFDIDAIPPLSLPPVDSDQESTHTLPSQHTGLPAQPPSPHTHPAAAAPHTSPPPLPLTTSQHSWAEHIAAAFSAGAQPDTHPSPPTPSPTQRPWA